MQKCHSSPFLSTQKNSQYQSEGGRERERERDEVKKICDLISYWHFQAQGTASLNKVGIAGLTNATASHVSSATAEYYNKFLFLLLRIIFRKTERFRALFNYSHVLLTLLTHTHMLFPQQKSRK